MSDERDKPQVIEQTAKLYKAMQLFGGVLLVISLALILPIIGNVAGGNAMNTRFAVGVAIAAGGGTALIAGKVLAWWHHG